MTANHPSETDDTADALVRIAKVSRVLYAHLKFRESETSRVVEPVEAI